MGQRGGFRGAGRAARELYVDRVVGIETRGDVVQSRQRLGIGRLHDRAVEGAYDYPLEPGMTLCVEVLVSEEGADFSIKLEDQVLITEDGYENLTSYPFDAALMGLT